MLRPRRATWHAPSLPLGGRERQGAIRRVLGLPGKLLEQG